MPLPSIGLISHGTSSGEGRRVIEALASAVTEDLLSRGLAQEVMLGHVDVQQPDVAEVLSALPHDSPVILVPLLLSPGYHVHVDLAEAIRAAGGADGRGAQGGGEREARRTSESRDIRLTSTLGPDPRLAQILAARLPNLEDEDQVVLAAAGSSDDRANDACLEMAESLAHELSRPVVAGFHAGGGDRLGDIVEQKRGSGGRVVLSSYLLAPGFFQDLASALIAESRDILTPPLLLDRAEAPSLLVEIVRDRIISAL
ncbi:MULTISPECIES: sirohydrochlorin chelatase [unclassified Brevibacterium]|uniref:sirohydrochlorin chelatase n=1 Tax=unclassified Brevibacterium TaxID=2614124 RepID=UPI000C5FCDEA|nr:MULTISPECIES: CbiX/SirB N-terminal domain-containing protein [unclassified Brevibacterium]SMY04804.1 Sirohydrochlorin ferrochelatase [Brevibacterium sp. 239c]